MSQIQIVLLSSGLSLLGVLVGSGITYFWALRLAKRNASREAGRRVREAFLPELAALDPAANFQGRAEELLREAWPRHQAAVSELMFHLPPKKRAALEKTWQDYYLVGGSIRFYDYHMKSSANDNPPERFQERVRAILKFTDM